MTHSKDNMSLHGSTCECHGMLPEPCRNSTNVNRKIVLIFALAVLLVLSGGITSRARGQNIVGTILVGAQVDPPSGSAGFRLTVDYAWLRNIVGSPPVISCAYMKPDGIWVPIGEINPSLEVVGTLLTEEMFINNQSTLDFNVALSDGTIQPGQYKVRCTSGPMYTVETAFSVVLDEAAKPTAESGPSEPEAPLRVYHLQVKTELNSSDLVLTAKWDGNLTVNPDGSVRAKVPGFLAADMPIRKNDKYVGNCYIDVIYIINVAGTAEITPSGITMHLMQTFDYFKVLPMTVSSNEQMPQGFIDAIPKAMEEAVPAYLDQILRGLDFENVALPASQDVSVGVWKGTAVLSPKK